MKKSIQIALVLLFTVHFVFIVQVMAGSDQIPDKNAVLALFGKLLSTNCIKAEQANFPLEAKRQILKEAGNENLVVISGFFYRDVNNNGQYDPGEELSATLLGKPEIETEGISCKTYFNCYWFDAVPPGKSYRIRYEHDGIKAVISEIKPRAGLNIFHIPVTPVKPLVYIIPHSHFDVEWAGSYEQNLKIEIPHIQQRLDLLQEIPAHGFLNDEECVTWPFVRRAGQKYVDMLKQGISDGMVEPKGIISQGELTMPYGESIIRCITYGERMLSNLMGERIRPQVFSSIDQYGYGYQMPQILKKAGRDYFLSGEYLSVDQESHRIPHSNPEVRNHSEFWLQGLDSSKVLVCSEPYGSTRFGSRHPSILYNNSVLNFQGTDIIGPDRNLTALLDSMNKANGQYKFIISPSTSFFRAIETSRNIPTFTSECFVNYWSGVYESRVEGRIRNRNIENRILASESLATIAALKGMNYPQNILDEAWYLLLLNQHHDPLMSPMAMPNLYEDCILPRYESAETLTNASLTGTLNWLASEITLNQQPGDPVIVFNPLANQRSVVVQAQIPAKLLSVRVTDLHGKIVPSQVIKKSGLTTSVAFLAEDLPSLGWKTYYVSNIPDKTEVSSGTVTATENLMENELLRIELKDGLIQKIIEKGSGTVVFRAESSAGVNEVFIWKDEGCISIVKPMDKKEFTCFINNPDAEITGRSSKALNRKITVLEAGPVRGILQIKYDLDWGSFIQKISVDAGSQVIRFTTNVLWNDADKISASNGRRVRVAFNSAYKNAKVFCDIPFGVIGWEQSEVIRPVNSWLGIENGTAGAAFFHHGPQSIQVVDDIVYMTLLRSVSEPPYDKNAEYHWDHPSDKAAENGEHTFNYEVYLHRGDWKAANVPVTAAGENAPVFVRVPNRHIIWEPQAPWYIVESKLLAGEDSFISLKPDILVVTAVKTTEYSNSGIIVRLYNPTNETVNGTLITGFPHRDAEVVNFREELIRPLAGKGNEHALEVAPYEIMTIRIQTGNKGGH